MSYGDYPWKGTVGLLALGLIGACGNDPIMSTEAAIAVATDCGAVFGACAQETAECDADLWECMPPNDSDDVCEAGYRACLESGASAEDCSSVVQVCRESLNEPVLVEVGSLPDEWGATGWQPPCEVVAACDAGDATYTEAMCEGARDECTWVVELCDDLYGECLASGGAQSDCLVERECCLVFE